MNRQDANYLAQTVARLTRAAKDGQNPAADALTLHRIAGSLHRMDERACNEDLGCPACGGEGTSDTDDGRPCHACAGRGRITGRREARLESRVMDIAYSYGFRAYFQGDPRGCPLYLIPATAVPSGPTQLAWIDSNYSSVGHAVPWLG